MTIDMNDAAYVALWGASAFNVYFAVLAARRARFFRDSKLMIERGDETLRLALSAARLAAMVHLQQVDGRKHDLVQALQQFVKMERLMVRQMMKVDRSVVKMRASDMEI